jgi:hypothetical protein
MGWLQKRLVKVDGINASSGLGTSTTNTRSTATFSRAPYCVLKLPRAACTHTSYLATGTGSVNTLYQMLCDAGVPSYKLRLAVSNEAVDFAQKSSVRRTGSGTWTPGL